MSKYRNMTAKSGEGIRFMLKIRTLGSFESRWGTDRLLLPPTMKSQSLLAYLVVHRRHAHRRDRLVGLFWGDRPERKARQSLSTALWHIRRCLPTEGLILSDLHTVQFDPHPDLWLDVSELESLVSFQDTAHLQAAVALYRGDFLDGFYDDWIINERYRLEALFLDALARLMAGHETRGEHEAALAVALRLLRHDPLREDAYRLTMRAYCRLGQRNAALEQYRRCREIVRAEISAEPMPETSALREAILEGRFPVAWAPIVVPVMARADAPPSPRPGRSPLDVTTLSPLVGREQELAFLRACWRGVEGGQGGQSPSIGGQGGLLLIDGEAGVGKTRLVEEFANHLRWGGVPVLRGRCYEFERALPYQPVAEALRAFLPILTPADLANFPAWVITEVARLAPKMADYYPDLETPVSTQPDQEQSRLFDGLARFLAKLSSHRALLIILEDLHWASESTLGLVHFLARQLADHLVLTVGTFRTEAIGTEHPLLAIRRQLAREGGANGHSPRHKRLHISRLPPQAVETLVVKMSGAGEAVLPLAKRLHRETEGNPFFLMEIVKALFETGAICLGDGAWQGDFARISEGTLPLPASVSEAIQARVARLDENAQETLRLAAVLGREFDFDLLNAVRGRGEETTLEALDDLLRHRLIKEGAGAVDRDYAFTHHKIQEAIYAVMPRRRRQHSHAQVGAAMESLYGPEAATVAGELAFHFDQGRQLDKKLTEKAITYLLLAGDQARTLYAHQEAIAHYQQALALLKEQGEYERAARTLMKLGLTHHNAFDFRGARQVYEEGFVLWQRAGKGKVTIPPPAPHALRVFWLNMPTLDPTMTSSTASSAVINQLFRGLVESGPELEITSDLARSWDVFDGGRKYIFHLQEDARWSDGVPVTAQDVEYTWKRYLEPATGSPDASLLYDVKGAGAFHRGETGRENVGVRALDKRTLAVELEGPTAYFLQLLADHATYPVPRHVVEAHGESWTKVENIVTNGPFRLEAWRPGESMVLVRNAGYRGRFTGNVQRVELALLPLTEWPTMLEMYEADQLDVLLRLWHLPPMEMDRVRRQYAGEYVLAGTLHTGYLAFDTQRPPFDDPRVRRAFVLAVDRETLADVILRRDWFPATGGLVPPGMPGHAPGIALPYDPERAGRLLVEAGYPGGRGFPVTRALAFSGIEAIVEYLRVQWRENLGVEVSCKTVQFGAFETERCREASHITITALQATYPDPDDFLRGGFLHTGGWQSTAYRELVEKARRIVDHGKRMKLYREAEKILVTEAPVVPYVHARWGLLVKPWVKRYPVSPLRQWFWKDVIIEPH